MNRRLTVYVRRGCHLCTDMTVSLNRLRDELRFSVVEVDIDRDPGLAERYGARVPVLAGGDVEICHYFLDEDKLRSWCASADSATDGQ